MRPIISPPNPRHDLPNRHTLAMGLTGSGKSQVIKQHAPIPANGVRTVLFDPSRDHATKNTHYYDTQKAFVLAIGAASQSGKGFRVAYDGPRSPEIYDWWCAQCIKLLDGNKMLYMLTEELAGVSANSGAALPNHRFILNESRKYGGVYVTVTQFPARISKDVYDNAGVVYFGRTAPRLQSRFASEYGLDESALKNLNNLEFLKWEAGKVEFLKLQYKKNN